MAGSHKVWLDGPYLHHRFEVSANPAHPLSRVPVLGSFITYNLGRNPQFIVSVKYLGYVAFERDTPDPSILPDPTESEGWEFDLYLEIGGELIEGGMT